MRALPHPFCRSSFVSLAIAAAMGTIVKSAVAQSIPEIRMGTGAAAEEQLWLMAVKPELCPNMGKAYTYTLTQFGTANQRLQAFEAGQLDAASSSMVGLVFAYAMGIETRAVANLCAESEKYFSTTYYALSDNPVNVSKDGLRGKTIGVNGFRQSLDLWARRAVQKVGLDPRRDVHWIDVPLPEMGDALRSKNIDVGVFPNAFAIEEQKKGGVKRLWTSASVSGVEEELDVYFSPNFMSAHPQAVRAWLADFRNISKYFASHERPARRALIDDGKWLKVPDPASYVNTNQANDLDRTYVKPKLPTMRKIANELVKAGWLERPVNVVHLIDDRFTA